MFQVKKDSIQYDEDHFNEKEDLISSDDNYEDDWPDFNSQTQLHVAVAGAKDLNRKGNTNNYEDDRPDSQTQLYITVAGAKVLKRKGKELRNLDPENKNTIISDTHVKKRPDNASLTKQHGPKSTSQPGSTITVSQCLTGCRIQCDRAHPYSFILLCPITNSGIGI